MNTLKIDGIELVEYGITTCKADLQAHLMPYDKKVHMFPTAVMRTMLEHTHYKERIARIDGQVTGRGVLVPVDDLGIYVQSVPIKAHLLELFDPLGANNKVVRGARAENLVAYLVHDGLFLPYIEAEGVTDKGLQRAGYDLILRQAAGQHPATCQVKLDTQGATHLFVQTHERNLPA